MAGGAPSSVEGTKSSVKIMANIFISFIGSGVLGLPYAFKEVGDKSMKLFDLAVVYNLFFLWK